MSTETRATPSPAVGDAWFKVGIVSGVIFGVVFGLLLWIAGEMPMIGSLVGMPTVIGGWVVHLVLSFVVVLGFAAMLSTPRLGRYARRLRLLVLLGLAYGVVIWVVIDAVVLSYLAQSAGIPDATVPGFALSTLVEDLVIGVGIALIYYGTRRWLVTGPPRATERP